MFGAFWTHDGSAQDPNALGRGNRWIIVGIVVAVPFCSHPVCLPVLLRLWRGKGTAVPGAAGGRADFVLRPGVSGHDASTRVGDAAYHGKALLVERTTFTTRLPGQRRAVRPAPPRTGKRGRPRLKGHRLGTPADLAATADWRRVTVSRYGRRETVEIADIRRHLVRRVRHPARPHRPGPRPRQRQGPGDLHHRHRQRHRTRRRPLRAPLADRDRHRRAANNCSASARPATACSARWNAPCRSSFCVYSLVIVWYTLHGYHPDDLARRRADQPWYPHKDDIAFEDMLAKLRRTLVAARITGVAAAQPDPRKYRDYELACAAAAA